MSQIKNLMDKDRRVSIEKITAPFSVSVGTVRTIIHEELKIRKIYAKLVPRVLIVDQKERRSPDCREMVELINSDPTVLDALVSCDESWIYCQDPETKRYSSQWKHACTPKSKKARQSKSTHKLDPFFDSTGMIYMHWVPTGQTVNKEYYIEVLMEFHQNNAPVNNSILVTEYLTKMAIKTARHPSYCQDLAPCDFWLLPKLKEKHRGGRYLTIEEMKEAVTKVIDTLKQEDFYGAFQKLLERYNKCIAAGGDYLEVGLEFHECTINKSAHTKKVWKLIKEPCVWTTYNFPIFMWTARILLECLHSEEDMFFTSHNFDELIEIKKMIMLQIIRTTLISKENVFLLLDFLLY